jgi:hypothetical protein
LVSDDVWYTETQSIDLTSSEVTSLLAALTIMHSRETEYDADGWLHDHNLIMKLVDTLRDYSHSGTGDGLPR